MSFICEVIYNSYDSIFRIFINQIELLKQSILFEIELFKLIDVIKIINYFELMIKISIIFYQKIIIIYICVG